MTIEIPLMPSGLKERYPLMSCESHEHYFRVPSLDELNRTPMLVLDSNTNAYSVFAHEYNSILLTAHLFENLLMLQDVAHENNGQPWFQIEIPEEYFRFPALNDPRNYEGYPVPLMSDEERKEISDAVKISKEKVNCSKDENLVKNNLHKLEFISIFSFLESYIENLRIECLGRTIQEASKDLRYESLPKIMEKTLDDIEPNINILLKKLSNNFYGFFDFCYLLRNLHSHNLGKVTPRFMEQCEKLGILEEDYGTKENGEKIIFGKMVNFPSYRKRIEIGKYITLSSVNFAFRNYVRESVHIVEQYIQSQEK
ncbi:TPA: hypothetical protein NG555_004372 [Vibrio parahaemolyticus]|nr:hypothetical protein [Vibrio parahaemolyticus]